MIKYLLDKGADITCTDKLYKNCIEIVVGRSTINQEIIQVLLRHEEIYKNMINNKEYRFMDTLCIAGNQDTLEFLIQAGDIKIQDLDKKEMESYGSEINNFLKAKHYIKFIEKSNINGNFMDELINIIIKNKMKGRILHSTYSEIILAIYPYSLIKKLIDQGIIFEKICPKYNDIPKVFFENCNIFDDDLVNFQINKKNYCLHRNLLKQKFRYNSIMLNELDSKNIEINDVTFEIINKFFIMCFSSNNDDLLKRMTISEMSELIDIIDQFAPNFIKVEQVEYYICKKICEAELVDEKIVDVLDNYGEVYNLKCLLACSNFIKHDQAKNGMIDNEVKEKIKDSKNNNVEQKDDLKNNIDKLEKKKSSQENKNEVKYTDADVMKKMISDVANDRLTPQDFKLLSKQMESSTPVEEYTTNTKLINKLYESVLGDQITYYKFFNLKASLDDFLL